IDCQLVNFRFGTLAGNPTFHLSLPGRRKAHDPGARLARRPALRNDSIEDGGPQRTAEVAATLAPIEAGPAQRTAAPFERFEVDVGLGEEPAAALRHHHR